MEVAGLIAGQKLDDMVAAEVMGWRGPVECPDRPGTYWDASGILVATNIEDYDPKLHRVWQPSQTTGDACDVISKVYVWPQADWFMFLRLFDLLAAELAGRTNSTLEWPAALGYLLSGSGNLPRYWGYWPDNGEGNPHRFGLLVCRAAVIVGMWTECRSSCRITNETD